MTTLKCKKEIMGIAALLVLFFHFYIPFGQSGIETFIYRASYIGVDLFFFVSAYSLISRNETGDFKYGKFLLNRTLNIYLPFVFLSIVCCLYKKWEFIRLIKVIFGVEFFTNGGGAFLWYFVGIMIIYILSPLFVFTKRKFKLWGLPILLVFWLVLVLILEFGFKYTKPFILLNRLPIFIMGLYFDDLILKPLSKLKSYYVYIIEVVLLVAGILLTNNVANIYRLNKPVTEFYYVVAIPLTISVVLIVATITDLIKNKYKSKVLSFIGKITLELYGLQMVFGYDIERFLLKHVSFKQLAFLGTMVILIALAFGFNQGIRIIKNSKKLFLKEETSK